MIHLCVVQSSGCMINIFYIFIDSLMFSVNPVKDPEIYSDLSLEAGDRSYNKIQEEM
jgi:hypothetical protein